jgi:hypothetical protein
LAEQILGLISAANLLSARAAVRAEFLADRFQVSRTAAEAQLLL